MSVELYLARRYLLDRQHGAWGWIISSIATGSVALGVAALIVTLSIMTGFREDIQKKMLGIHPHIFLTSFSGKFLFDSKAQTQLTESKSIVSYSPFLTGQVLIGRGKNSSGATIKGIDPIGEPSVSNINAQIHSGELESLLIEGDKPGIILGKELARQIGARKNDVVWTITPNNIGLGALSLPKAHLFRVKGFIESGLYDYDSVLAYTHLRDAQTLFDYGDHISAVGARIKDPSNAPSVAKQLQTLFAGKFWVRSWLSQNKNLFSALKLERIVMFLILMMLTVVAAFMIVSNLLLIVSYKVKEIGILKAMGATRKMIRNTFLFQGLIMGIVGNGIGVALGIGLSLLLSKTNFIRLPADVYYIDHLPIVLVPSDILMVIVLSIMIVLLATLFPSYKAAKLDPIEAIRYG